MVIYMVEHTFALPEMEDEWNAWYAGNLKVLLGVPGFRTGQRFRAVEASPARYMAMYTLERADVLESEAYKKAGGGGTASRRFRVAYAVWIRNLFEGPPQAPDVPEGRYLAVLDGERPDRGLEGHELTWLKSVGLHMSTPYRALAVVTESDLPRIRHAPGGVVYRPITRQHGAAR